MRVVYIDNPIKRKQIFVYQIHNILTNSCVLLTNMLCAKKGMTDREWEDLFHEQKIMQSLRQKGIPEHFIREIVAYLIHAVLANNAKTSS